MSVLAQLPLLGLIDANKYIRSINRRMGKGGGKDQEIGLKRVEIFFNSY